MIVGMQGSVNSKIEVILNTVKVEAQIESNSIKSYNNC